MAGVLIHEWLSRHGGSENVFEVLSAMYPDAERFCLWNDSDGRFEGVGETALARTPLRGRKALALPFMPAAWRHLPASDADWVLTSSHVFAHHARLAGPARHAPKLVYAHTPARYVWTPELDGRGAGPLARAASLALRPLDRRRAQEPVAIAANSAFVAQRVADAWEREATVIHPPVDVDSFAREPDDGAEEELVRVGVPAEFLLGVSRFVPYKRLGRVIDAGAATGLPVVLAGSGPDEGRLAGEDLVTLVTCTPLGINSHRILVTGERVTPTPVEDIAAAGDALDIPGFPWWAVMLGAGTLVLSAFVWRSGYTDARVRARGRDLDVAGRLSEE